MDEVDHTINSLVKEESDEGMDGLAVAIRFNWGCRKIQSIPWIWPEKECMSRKDVVGEGSVDKKKEVNSKE